MYTELPIFKKALELNAYLDTIVKGFSKYYKYGIGEELREKAREVLFAIYKIYFSKDKKEAIINLRNCNEELKIILVLAKELKGFNSFKQFELSSKLCFEIAKQSQAWLNALK